MSPEDAETRAKDLFAALLAVAQGHRNRLENFRLEKAGLTAKDWLCVVGVDATTRARLKVIKTPSGPDFQFRSIDRDNQWSAENDPVVRRLTGDGTVPFEGALSAFLAPENVVCVTPDDYGYWEIQDKLVTKVAGFHGILPNMDMLHRLIVRHFTGAPDDHGNTWGCPAPGVTDWQPPLDLNRKE